jgi:hypothetical protein
VAIIRTNLHAKWGFSTSTDITGQYLKKSARFGGTSSGNSKPSLSKYYFIAATAGLVGLPCRILQICVFFTLWGERRTPNEHGLPLPACLSVAYFLETRQPAWRKVIVELHCYNNGNRENYRNTLWQVVRMNCCKNENWGNCWLKMISSYITETVTLGIIVFRILYLKTKVRLMRSPCCLSVRLSVSPTNRFWINW